ncbi:hypothetical protein [Flavobacterium beibuense]|uniref:Arginyl-tRNA synthetase n=1 Tax=Flavobacterium beibuense F44-8 TaxID=1406840 RepID=A0A0A2LZD4_9FLAO|nr:hypothetical protein [Flavobacterium beibuense]KGO81490.1 hypothetical protein Q763_07530 [Flavobacterium beibuense F44-8]
MNVSKVIGIILIVISLGVGYIGVNKVADSTKAINFLGIEIDASNESGQMQGFIYLGGAILLFAGGLYAVRKSSN